jgi:hypothetical protein
MQKNANTSPPGKNSDDILEGLFISPLEESESFEKMEADEARVLSPLREPRVDAGAGSAAAPHTDGGDQTPLESQPRVKAAYPTPPEQATLRIAGELRSIKQDLLSIKQLFEAMKRSQPGQTAQSAKAPEANPSSDTRGLLDDIRKLLLYLDRLLESLPEEKIEEFANSEFFNLYRQIFEKLGLS